MDIRLDGCIIYNFAREGLFRGKKSLIPSFCDLYGYRCTGSNDFVISLLRNKYIYLKYLQAHGILVSESWIFDKEKKLVQQFPDRDGDKCEVFVLRNFDGSYQALDPIKVVSGKNANVFEPLEETTTHFICEEICIMAERCALLLDIGTNARVDFHIDNEGNICLLDIIDAPYTTLCSSLAFLFTYTYGHQYKNIYKIIVELTLSKYSGCRCY